jgi:hypothetical protein
MSDNLTSGFIQSSVKKYKQRFFLNLLLRGVILFLAIGMGYFLLINLLEYFGWFGSTTRAIFFFSFIGLVGVAVTKWVIKPLYQFLNAENSITDEQAASDLGKLFPDVKDKLLNILQLGKVSSHNSQLTSASIRQKSAEIAHVPFEDAVDFRENRKYLRFIIPVLIVASLGFVLIPGVFTESPKRIVQFTKIFPKPAPFTFRLLEHNLHAFRNEDFELRFVVEGKELPEDVSILVEGQQIQLQTNEDGEYVYVFARLQHPVKFQLEGAGFMSSEYEIKVINKPLIGSLNARVSYPAYLGKKEERLANVGNLTVPEGTQIEWVVNCLYTDKVHLLMSSQNQPQILEASLGGGFAFSTLAKKSFAYKLKLLNDNAQSDGELDYSVTVVPDLAPKVSMMPVKDSSLFNYILLGGSIEDDHGFSSLKLFFKINKKGQNNPSQYAQVPIRFLKGNTFQNFYFSWGIDTLGLQPGDKLEYFAKVWDNDGVNGPKPATSQVFSLELPSEKSIKDDIKNKQSETAESLGNSHAQSKNLSKQLDQLQDKLKNKKELSWQDKKNLESLLDKQNDFKEKLEDLLKQNQMLNDKEEKFLPMNEELAEKTQQLQDLMKEILDDETLKLYEELKKLLEEKNNSADIKDLLEKLDNKQERFDKELERALEMFKQLKFEKELDMAIEQTDKLAKEQEQLAKQTPNENQNLENLQKEQKKLNEEFKELSEDFKKLDELNKSLQEKNEFDPEEAIQKSISEKQQNSSEQLNQNNRKAAQKQQKSASDQMQDLKQQLQTAQQSMEKETVEENVQDLRFLLENLLALSFEQETLMKEFKRINQTDPRYVHLLQREVKLKDDAKLVEDSLFALSKRVFQLKKFVTKEVGDMNDYIKESIDALKQRRPDISAGKQQFTMTSMNNLALMLSDILKQLQEQQQQMQKKPGGGQCKKPGGKSKNPSMSMSDLQKSLNQRIEQLKNGGKQGKEMSQELAKMIAEQQAIRKMLKEMEGKIMDPNGKQQLKELAKKMEETEKDMAFKQLSPQTIMRQNEIMTRLLESEKAQKEREFEENRESHTGKQELGRKYPPALDKYLKEKDKQIEMLKSTPPSLNPYYKEKVGQYFQKISE